MPGYYLHFAACGGDGPPDHPIPFAVRLFRRAGKAVRPVVEGNAPIRQKRGGCPDEHSFEVGHGF